MNFRAILICLFFIGLVVLAPQPSQATVMQSEDFIFIGPDEIIDDNLFIITDRADIQGQIKGDLIIAGNTANIKGEVEGDIFVLATNELVVSGKVGGDLRALANRVSLTSQVGGNVTVATDNLFLGEEAEIGHSLYALASQANINGVVAKNISLLAGQANLNAPVGRNVFVRLGQTGQLTLLPKTRVGGDVQYVATSDLTREPGSEIAGVISRIDLVIDNQGELNSLWLALRLVWFLSLLLTALLLVNVFPIFVRQLTDLMLTKTVKMLWPGMVGFIFIPLIGLLLLVTIIALPISLALFAFYFVALYVSQVLAGLALGRAVVKKITTTEGSLLLPAIYGIIIIGILMSLPILGFVFKILLIWWGFSGLLNWLYAHYRSGLLNKS